MSLITGSCAYHETLANVDSAFNSLQNEQSTDFGTSWLRGTVVKRQSLAGKLQLHRSRLSISAFFSRDIYYVDYKPILTDSL